LSDGECAEGQVWEAIMAAKQYKLDNLTAILDKQRHPAKRLLIKDIMNIEPFKYQV